MINSVSIYLDVMDKVAEEQNGSLSISRFNRFSRQAELYMLGWLSGDVAGIQPPEPYSTQKDRDLLSHLLVDYKAATNSGKITKPDGYYLFDSLYVIGTYRDELCGKDTFISGYNTPIELVSSGEFDDRNNSSIKGIKPTIEKPIAKMIGNDIQFSPSDLGSVGLQYIKYPVFGEVKTKIDQVYNDEVPDTINSIPYNWPEALRNMLVYYIVAAYPVRTRENALAQQLQLENKGNRP